MRASECDISTIKVTPLEVSDAEEETAQPYFFPPLFMMRRAFILDLLKKEGIRSMVELGCGKGSILSCVAQPAAHIDDFPNDVDQPEGLLPNHARSVYKQISQVKEPSSQDKELHLSRLAGLDVDAESLQQAIGVTAPIMPEAEEVDSDNDLYGFKQQPLRWEKLKVELWEGGLEVHNDSLDDYECFVASEVVEHLHNGPLRQFGRIVLGIYRPRIVVITTPNYDFHPYFPAESSTGDEDQHRFPDPTKRTDRIFRDSDHKFELTAREFKTWCEDLAKEYEYTVDITGVGELRYYRKDLDLSDHKEPLFATQCAVFRRVYAYQAERSPRSPRIMPLPFFSPLSRRKSLSPKSSSPKSDSTNIPHELLKTHLYDTQPEAGNAMSLAEIRQAMIELFEFLQQGQATLRQLWSRNYLAKRCGGHVAQVIHAIAQDPEEKFAILVDDQETGLEAVTISYKDFVPLPENEEEHEEADAESD